MPWGGCSLLAPFLGLDFNPNELVEPGFFFLQAELALMVLEWQPFKLWNAYWPALVDKVLAVDLARSKCIWGEANRDVLNQGLLCSNIRCREGSFDCQPAKKQTCLLIRRYPEFLQKTSLAWAMEVEDTGQEPENRFAA